MAASPQVTAPLFDSTRAAQISLRNLRKLDCAARPIETASGDVGSRERLDPTDYKTARRLIERKVPVDAAELADAGKPLAAMLKAKA